MRIVISFSETHVDIVFVVGMGWDGGVDQLISSIDRHKPCMEHPIKFLGRRLPHSLKFKINPGNRVQYLWGAIFLYHWNAMA